jgi:hypothetical protein
LCGGRRQALHWAPPPTRHPAAGNILRFEDSDLAPRFLQLIGGGQSGDAGTNDCNTFRLRQVNPPVVCHDTVLPGAVRTLLIEG